MTTMDARLKAQLHAAVEAAFRSFSATYAERKVLKAKDYEELMSLLKKRMTGFKLLMVPSPVYMLLWIIRQFITEGGVLHWGSAIVIGIGLVGTGAIVAVGVRQLIIAERARFALEILVGDTASASADAESASS